MQQNQTGQSVSGKNGVVKDKKAGNIPANFDANNPPFRFQNDPLPGLEIH